MGAQLDGYRLVKGGDGQWGFVEGRKYRKSFFTREELSNMNKCFERRGLQVKGVRFGWGQMKPYFS